VERAPNSGRVLRIPASPARRVSAISFARSEMTIGDPRLWRSQIVCWSLCGLFSALAIIWQLADVIPYPNMYRDWLIGTLLLRASAVAAFACAVRARKRTKKAEGEPARSSNAG
jgi:hypothetical protein